MSDKRMDVLTILNLLEAACRNEDAELIQDLDIPNFIIRGGEFKKAVHGFANDFRGLFGGADESKGKHGLNVAVVLPNCSEYLVTFFGIGAASAVNCLLNPKFKHDEFEFAFSNLECGLLIVDSNGNKEAEAAAEKLNIPVVAISWDVENKKIKITPKTDKPFEKRYLSPSPKGNDTMLKLHTSGTTSKPKTVPISQANIVCSTANIARTYSFKSGVDCGLVVMPLFHVHGLFCGAVSPISRGSKIVLARGRGFHKSTFWEDVVSTKVNWVTAVPSMWQILLSAPELYPSANPPHLRFVRGCSSSLAPAVAEQIESQFKTTVIEAYAMTEATHQMTSNMSHKRVFGSVGQPQGIEAVIVDDETKKVCKYGEPGEICVRGYNVVQGYQGLSAEANAKNFHVPTTLTWPTDKDSAAYISTAVNLFASGKSDYDSLMSAYFSSSDPFPVRKDWTTSPIKDYLFLKTGDVGVMSEDGFIKIVGRSKELINRGGEKIAPAEIDAVFLSMPEVAQACSFGGADTILGEVVHIGIKLAAGVSEAPVDIAAKFRTNAKTKLAPFKIPVKIYLVNELPTGPTGKVLRREMPDFVKGMEGY